MSKANEFQIYANECFAWAKDADTQEKREQFIGLAQTWMQAAVLEGRGEVARAGLNNEAHRDQQRGR
jgi:hypothetical protein